jgi:hypothetical protein
MRSYSAADRVMVGDLRQIAAVRRITLDDGAERGVRALAFSTGGGLDFWALSDRALDIGPLWWRGVQLAWIGPGGFRSPFLHDAESEGGQGFGRMLGGLVNTGGLDHIRQPQNGQPLHGRFAFTPTNVRAYGEDWDRPDPLLYAEAEATQGVRGGPSLRLHRRIEARIGGTSLTIIDTVANIGAKPVPQAILYHCNLGFPSISQGTIVVAGGVTLLGPIVAPDPDADTVVTSHIVMGETGECRVQSRLADGRAFAVVFRFDAKTLPYLQLMHDLRPHAMIVAIEPCTSARHDGGLSGPERMLAPGETRCYRLDISVEAPRSA